MAEMLNIAYKMRHIVLKYCIKKTEFFLILIKPSKTLTNLMKNYAIFTKKIVNKLLLIVNTEKIHIIKVIITILR
jgi:hypothetical protein